MHTGHVGAVKPLGLAAAAPGALTLVGEIGDKGTACGPALLLGCVEEVAVIGLRAVGAAVVEAIPLSGGVHPFIRSFLSSWAPRDETRVV